MGYGEKLIWPKGIALDFIGTCPVEINNQFVIHDAIPEYAYDSYPFRCKRKNTTMCKKKKMILELCMMETV